MDNYYVFNVLGEKANEYLGGTNFVGLWANDKAKAYSEVEKYFPSDTPIIYVEKSEVNDFISYLY